MKRVLTAAVLAPVVLLIVFRAPLWLFVLAVAALIALALREYLGIAEAAGIRPFRGLTYVMAVLPVIHFSYNMWRVRTGHPAILLNFWIMVPMLAVIFGIPLVFRNDLRGGLASVAVSLFGVLYIGVSLSLLTSFRNVIEILLLIFVLFSVWAGDIAAYYVGKNIGRHKLAPVVSPNKSWEGAIASIIASITVAFLIMHFRQQSMHLVAIAGGTTFDDQGIPYPPIPYIHIICLGIATNIAAQLGDLFESALKRGAGVKDSGTLLPGHGGILDRIDALLFAIPMVWYYSQSTGLLNRIID
jgi:phosphatidate cytidylyltransferase